MTPHYSDPWLTVYAGDCRDVLPTLAADSVDCVVTSPPYWGLRDYGTATWIGGDEGCDHIEVYNLKRDASGGLGGGRDLGTRGVQGNTSSSKIGYRHTCGKCGATRLDAQLGLEPTPEEYVANLVAVFPPELPERCIKAGSSEAGVCPECGAPWVRMVEQRPYPAELANATKAHGGIGNNLGGQRHQDWLDANPKQTTGWRPACSPVHHIHELPQPAVILDPFAGSGTVGLVANRLSRRAILIDLNPEYLRQQMQRNAQTPLGLAGR